MGTDAKLFVTLLPGADVPEHLSLAEYDRDIPEVGAYVYTPWETDKAHRYYAPGYQRGHWPTIREVIVRYMRDTRVKNVYYFGDNGAPSGDWWEQARPLSLADISVLDVDWVMKLCEEVQ